MGERTREPDDTAEEGSWEAHLYAITKFLAAREGSRERKYWWEESGRRAEAYRKSQMEGLMGALHEIAQAQEKK